MGFSLVEGRLSDKYNHFQFACTFDGSILYCLTDAVYSKQYSMKRENHGSE